MLDALGRSFEFQEDAEFEYPTTHNSVYVYLDRLPNELIITLRARHVQSYDNTSTTWFFNIKCLTSQVSSPNSLRTQTTTARIQLSGCVVNVQLCSAEMDAFATGESILKQF